MINRASIDRASINRATLARLHERELAEFARRNPRSAEAYAAADHLFGRVPMTWMNKKAGGFPLYFESARGSRISDIDGHEYLDFALGDTGAMAGHSPQAVLDAVSRRIDTVGGITTMMPTVDAEWVGAELSRRFGMDVWSFSLTATDANRWAIRLVRALTGRSKILFHSYSYHGSVDESLIVVGPDGEGMSRPGNVGSPVDVTLTSRVAEINDLPGLERQLKHGDVAAVLIEPALTNIGIVLPEPGYHAAVRELTRRYGALLIIDETHTFSAGSGGATRAWGLEPDIVVIGKAIADGVPSGAYGLSQELAERALARDDLDLIDMGGVGGTLAGSPLSIAAMRATLQHVLTDDAFEGMIARATTFAAGIEAVIVEHDLPWAVAQLGARVEYRFARPYPTTGTASAESADADLEDYLHLALANRGILLTPFHNMALMAPTTTDDDVARHLAVFAEIVGELVA
ncbi:transaminase [Lacisediminihabitans changchengi]|uniref:Aminotransferase class III-fold pyridoxal phosphate-dependent enzyme n=1 Tax=Lacisediminihabitans changchengi TaxID=2787634 RepID=A0A934SPA1_9MICO|nr:transaminase [Lacisediminihabitans changchengi]MBK4346490.1 aminotransferase class III-fold pyridoxal phosphate-dependent enzyme [Lacisediminihabitans changchengi]